MGFTTAGKNSQRNRGNVANDIGYVPHIKERNKHLPESSSLPNEVFLDALSRFWTSVQPLNKEEAENFFAGFVVECIVPDLQRKFMQEFAKTSRRYFQPHTTHHIKEKLSDVIGSPIPGTVTIRVSWSVKTASLAFLLKGIPTTANKIFIDEGNAIAQVSFANIVDYLFLDGSSGDLLHFRSKSMATEKHDTRLT